MAGVVTLLWVAAACPAPYEAWVSTGNTPGMATFGIGESRGSTDNPYAVARVEVATCGGYRPDMTHFRGRTVWVARAPVLESGPPPNTPPVTQVRYGAPLPGIADSVAAAPLGPGCYRFYVYAHPGRHASLQFWVQRDGTVRESTRHEKDSVSALIDVYFKNVATADAQALASCRIGYGNARSVADSGRVDAQVPYDTTRYSLLTCADLRRVSPREVAQIGGVGAP